MSELKQSTHAPDADGNVLRVTPDSAGWRHVGFEVYRLAEGQRLARETGGQEFCLVLLGGRATIETAEETFADIGGRVRSVRRSRRCRNRARSAPPGPRT